MTIDELKDRFRRLNVWRSGGQRAPHKPLLTLLALGRLRNGAGRWLRYADVEAELEGLLIAFGPPRRVLHPEYPFWRLQNDGIWVIPERTKLRASPAGEVTRAEFIKGDAYGGFPDEVEEILRHHPGLVLDLASELVECHFPESLRQDLLAAVGLDCPGEARLVRPRDPRFRDLVLRAYEYRCAICGFHVRLGNALIGLDAAHVRWHQAGGPSSPENGLALCTLHHKLFDRGAFTLTADRLILLSQDLHGFGGFEEFLLRFHGQPIRPPQATSACLAEAHVGWHRSEVFHGPAREL